ncbi:MAG: HlyD family efflux transporter periplasmic adaptor subunit [Aristaeellaceae bacterium]
MKKATRWMVLAAAAALVVAVIVLVRPGREADGAQADADSVYTVGLGDVETTITCSGRLEAENTTEILLPEGIRVERVCVRQGDAVQAGEVLAVLDTASLQRRASELSGELASLDQQLGARRTVASIKTPVKGRVKYLPAVQGEDVMDTVSRFGALAILSTDGLMQLPLATEQTLALHTAVLVKWNGGSAEGCVAGRIEGGWLVTLSDEQAPYLGSAEVYCEGTRIGSGTLEIHEPLTILGSGGVIGTVHAKTDGWVEAGATLFTLEDAPETDAYRQAMARRSDKAEQLQAVLACESSPYVIAEEAGTVHAVAVADGDSTVSSDGSGQAPGFTLGTGGAVKMTVRVDEMDVSRLKVGQRAEITLDAFPAETFPATVTRISRVGEAAGSITTYAAELRLSGDSSLLEGMNGSAVILSDSVQGAVLVPLGAVHEDEAGPYVEKLGPDAAPVRTSIETGLSDGWVAEVLTGLAAGDRIVYGGAQ